MKTMDWKEVYILFRKNKEWNKLEKYLKSFDENKPLGVENIWNIMNQVWDDMGLDNKNYNSEQLSKYYSHPVWFLNGCLSKPIKS